VQRGIVDMMHDLRLNQKTITWFVSGQHAESQFSLFFSSGDTFSSRLMLHDAAIHRINKSLSCFLMYACLDLKSRRARSSAFLLQLSLSVRFCILVSVSSSFRQNSWLPIGNQQNEYGIIERHRYFTVIYKIWKYNGLIIIFTPRDMIRSDFRLLRYECAPC